MRRIGYALIALFVLGFLAVPLIGCRLSTDLTNVGCDADGRLGPKDSPIAAGAGAHVSLGKHEIEVQHPLPSGARAAEGSDAPSDKCAGGKCGVPAGPGLAGK